MLLDRHEIIAVNVALLLPPDAMERVARLNSLLYAEQPEGFLFGPTVVPHITIAQLFVRRENLLALIRQMDVILSVTEPLELAVTKIAGRNQICSLRLTRTAELLRVHASLMDEVKLVSESEGSVESFFEDKNSPAREMDVAYVSSYRKRSSYTRYVPHITLGYGHPPVPDVFMDFVCRDAALFQLGRFCTGRQLVHHWKLH